MTRVFVYGTLRQGGANHWLLEHAAFEGATWTRPEFTLVDLGEYPAMVEGGTTAVEGEVYRVDAATLEQLDRLEEYPGYYDRVEVVLEDGGRALAYTLRADQVTGNPAIPSGRWEV